MSAGENSLSTAARAITSTQDVQSTLPESLVSSNVHQSAHTSDCMKVVSAAGTNVLLRYWCFETNIGYEHKMQV